MLTSPVCTFSSPSSLAEGCSAVASIYRLGNGGSVSSRGLGGGDLSLH